MADGDQSGAATMVALGEDYPELRQSIRRICEGYPGDYWRALEAGRPIRPNSSTH